MKAITFKCCKSSKNLPCFTITAEDTTQARLIFSRAVVHLVKQHYMDDDHFSEHDEPVQSIDQHIAEAKEVEGKLAKKVEG